MKIIKNSFNVKMLQSFLRHTVKILHLFRPPITTEI